jgi:hypothetical protein
MTINRGIITTGTLLLLGLSATAPAGANPLLSGYGGPGQGNQAILGSALLGAPGGGGAGGSPGGASGAGGGSPGVGPAAGGSRVGSAGARRSGRGSARAGKHPGAGAGQASGVSPQPYIASSDTNVGSQALGLSGQDLLLIFVALVLLAVTAALTRQLARRPR